jgi:hypothetical protein
MEVSKSDWQSWRLRLTHALRWRKKRDVRRGREVFVLEKFAKRDGRTVHRVFALFARVDTGASIHVTS